MKALQLIGRTFGKLTVLELHGKDKNRKYCWLCRCDCGQQCIVRGDCLTHNKTKSCGCLPSGKPPKDLTGRKFGLLTATSQHSKYLSSRGQNRWKWLCSCECGNETVVRTDSLLSGVTQSCGCRVSASNRNHKWTGFGEIDGTFWQQVIRGAKIRNIPFSLTIEDAWGLFIQQNKCCALSGELLAFAPKTHSNLRTASLDRKDSGKGYTIDNVQWVHKTINNMKQSLFDVDFITWCNKVSHHSQESRITNVRNDSRVTLRGV